MSGQAPLRLARKPVLYSFKNDAGKIETTRRRPPPTQHEILPTDEVYLNVGKNEDWGEGEYTVKHINPRHPNILQIKNEDDEATFVHYFELDLEEKVAIRDDFDSLEQAKNNQYLLWP